jgi:tetratricopeptide (TPR) repeat protein
MSRTGSYGQSFVMKLLSQDKLDEALAEAERAVTQDPEDPEVMFDRAQVHLALEHWEAGVADVEHALELDRTAHILDDSELDDALFSALVAWGRQVAESDRPRALTILERYLGLFPKGGHHKDYEEWKRRLGGEQRTSWTRTR